ncbi:S8 family peptidase [Oceanithermus sp.]
MKKLSVFLVLTALFALTSCSTTALEPEGTDYIAVIEPSASWLQSDVFMQTVDALAADYGLTIQSEDRLTALGTVILRSLTPEQAEALARDPRVYALSPDREVQAFRGGPPSSDEPEGQVVPWGIDRIGATTTISKGAGVSVYVVDTGIKVGHEDLTNYVSDDGYAAVTCKGSGCAAPWDDDNGHGTHVAGTVGATDNDVGVIGVAPQATLHAVKVLSNTGSGSTTGIIAGIEWVIEHDNGGRPKVINMSLGGAGSDDQDGQYCPSVRSTDAFHNVIQKAVCDYNVTVVVAAGNENADASTSTPAAYDEVITVSATDANDDWPYWSNYGDDVDIAAPGVSILSTWNDGGYNTISGTSMATPHVTGAAALVLSLYPDYTPAEVKAALLANAEDTSDWTNTSGNPHPEPFLNVRGF